MGRAELEQEKWEWQAWADAYDAQERELNDLASSVAFQLEQKSQQRELARLVKEKCDAVRMAEHGFARDVKTYGSKIARALDESGASRAMSSSIQGADGYASGAVREAEQLLQRLEAEWASLSGSVADYRSRAESAASSARECWDRVACLQQEIDWCEE